MGRAAHAGMYPEDGRSAIVAAARAIVDMPLGRIDEVTSANVGLVRGGTARNVVPERCTLEAEVRSHDDARVTEVVQQIVDAAAFAASVSECSLETRVEPKYRGYRFRDDDLARAPRGGGARPAPATRRGSGCRAARPTRTSSTPAASSASTSRTG